MAMKTGYRILTAVIISSIIPAIVYYINVVPYGHDPRDVQIILISLVQFFDFFLGFVCYWLIRNLFSKRWAVLNTKMVSSKIFRFPIEKISTSGLLPTENSSIHALVDNTVTGFVDLKYKKSTSLLSELIFPRHENNKTLVFYCHGFNDSTAKIRYKTYALAELGYTVFVWDARGMGNSSKAGKKSDFLSRNLDTAVIVDYFSKIPHFQEYQFAIIGESMGGICAAYAMKSFPKIIDKCVLISTPSIFNETFPKKVIPFSKKAFQRFSYRVRGINPYPVGEANEVISPYFLFQTLQKEYSEQDWKEYTSSRFLFIHSKTDGLIPIQKYEQNASVLQLSTQNLIRFETGNHNQNKNELGIISAIDCFIQKK
ncbi:MAG: alpha/beta fold hydrolase [Promethearchaeota archaeon]|nr:MAG: alpha/beta fold hydrolase [Candidatus Lokiarchaeota archaeon]